ncbi:MAG: glycine cleavage system aminomethyltransferase GcvT, partial [Candidatus Riflebacteria bacterium]|nr:glycine cleavage system aminomethyltransferase GcvT [Candidatus Riflebacteria bacterium]
AAAALVFAGFIMPVSYSSILDEHQAVRTAAGLFDLTHMGEFWLEGASALADVQRLVTNDVSKLAVGQALYTPMCYDNGTIVDDLLVYRFGEERFLLVVNASNIDKDRKWVTDHLCPATRFTDASDETALVAIQGPRAIEILAGLFPAASDVKPFHFTKVPFEGTELVVARTGYTGEDGFEVFVPNARSRALWKALCKGPVKPVGLGARDTLRMEARLPLYGNDIDDTTTPLEAGIGWTVKLDKSDFIGKGVLLAQQQKGLARKLFGFKMVGRGIARHGCDVLSGGTVVGHVTSGSFSPTLKENVGLAYLPVALASPGVAISIRIREKEVAAETVKTPFYKRSR